MKNPCDFDSASNLIVKNILQIITSEESVILDDLSHKFGRDLKALSDPLEIVRKIDSERIDRRWAIVAYLFFKFRIKYFELQSLRYYAKLRRVAQVVALFISIVTFSLLVMHNGSNRHISNNTAITLSPLNFPTSLRYIKSHNALYSIEISDKRISYKSFQPEALKYPLSFLNKREKITVPEGEEYIVQLADGSNVLLSSQSTLEFTLFTSNGNREVKLKGEAFFDVKSDTQHPFIVRTSMGDVVALGTSFKVRDYLEEEKVEVILESGLVAYSPKSHSSKKLLLLPGDKIIDKKEQGVIKEEPSESTLANLTEESLVFSNLPLSKILKILEYLYNIEFVYETTSIREFYYSGSIKKHKDLESILDFLETCGDFQFEIIGSHKIFIKLLN
ncbi:MAG: FecR domain-containing protein [Bacteroidales bacterium]